MGLFVALLPFAKRSLTYLSVFDPLIPALKIAMSMAMQNRKSEPQFLCTYVYTYFCADIGRLICEGVTGINSPVQVGGPQSRAERSLVVGVRGFTLIELLVALAIAAILSLVVVPSYQAYVQQSYRVTAQTDLTACAQSLRGRAGSARSYLNFADTNDDGLGDASVGPIARDVCQPVSHVQGNYQLSINGTSSEFALTATSVNDSLGAGALGLSSSGAKFWDENADGVVGVDENDWILADES
ncbi:prepilin-type N-terminal cleavage/methylation domain-containing protein [Pseudomonadales bacterium]|nr:prepilin-type N-terminal cleavage/methylation domain-containing protein [Pseudomonadales bacterium]